MNRKDMLNKLQEPGKVWDMVVVGGGATGLGVAVDAATRGYSVALLEMADLQKVLQVVVRNWYMVVYVIFKKEMSH